MSETRKVISYSVHFKAFRAQTSTSSESNTITQAIEFAKYVIKRGGKVYSIAYVEREYHDISSFSDAIAQLDKLTQL